MVVVDWKSYLESICKTYAQWWECYTITDVVGEKHSSRRKDLLLDLKAIALPPEKQQSGELEEKKEVFNVLEGLREYAAEHVLLIGRPGSGKSTALARLLLEEATVATDASLTDETDKLSGDKTDHLSASSATKSVAIPVLVELRYYKNSILDLIKDFLHRHDGSLAIDDETLKNLMRQGKFVLLLDGVNELPSASARRDLQKFRQDFHKTTPMIFTTRDLGVGGDLEISKKLQMQPLTETQMQEFVRGYLPDVGEVMLQQLGGRLRKFGETPLLLMMLCSVFASNGNKLPPNLGSVFRTFTEIYDSQLKQDIPVADESRRWWKGLLQHLAWVMMTSPLGGEGLKNSPPSLVGKGVGGLGVNANTEFLVAIPRQQVEEIFTEFLEGKVNCAANCALAWLEDLLKHHLIQLGADNKIEFRHQLIQEYYAAERFLQQVGKLSDEQLQWDYLNYLKWTEPAVLMMELIDDEALALRVVKLALQVDWQLGARLAGAVKSQWQEKTVGLIYGLGLPQLLEIKLLGISKSATAIPGLIKLLEHQDSDVRYRAAEALGKIKSSTAIPGLIKLLEHQDSDVRYMATDALGEMKSSTAIPGLIKLLEDEDSDVRSRAAEALGEIKSSTAVSGLIKLLEDENSGVRSRAADALGKIKSSTAIPGLIKLLEHQDSGVRYSAADALGKIKSSTAIPGLIKLLEHQDSDVRSRAAKALGEIKSSTAVTGLIKLLEDENSGVRYRAAYALGKIKSSTAVPELIKLLEDEDSGMRCSAASALGEIKSSTAVTGLIKLLENEDEWVRCSAASALGKIKSSTAVPGLIKLLEDESIFVPFRAAEALGEMKSEAAIPELIKLLEHQDKRVRYIAEYAQTKIKSDKLLEDEDSLEDEDGYELYMEEYLVELILEADIPWLIKLLEDQDSYVRSTAAKALVELISEAAISELIKFLEHQDSGVRYSAAEALGEIKSEKTIVQLIQALNTKSFITANSGHTAVNAIKALETIQQHLKYYQPKPILTMSTSLSHNYALLIGVGECEEPKLSLPVTVKDIQALKTLLIDQNLCGYIDDEQHLQLLHDETATSQNILDALDWLQEQAKNDPEATILIYYSGHGYLAASGDYYLIPHDTDRVDIPDTALSAAKFNAALQQIPAKRLLVVIDSCHAQGMASSKEGKNNRSPLPKGFEATALPKNIIEELKQGTGRVVFTSSTGKQSSWIRRDGKMSVYTYHFLEALQGAANQPGDKVVRVSHLMNYLAKTVPETVNTLGKEQTPFFDFATEDFPVALLRGGKGLPTQGWEAVKPEAEERISSISNLVNNGVGNVGDGNIGINIGTAGNITIGDISSKS